MTLAELKAKATELGLTTDEVRQHGSLSKKATWETAIAEFKQWKESVDTHCEEMGIPQWSYPEDSVEDEPIETAIFSCQQQQLADIAESYHLNTPQWSYPEGELIETDTEELEIATETERVTEDLPFEPTHTLINGDWVEVEDKLVSNSFTAIHSSPIPPFEPMEGWHRWDEKLKAWVKENPEETLKDCYQPESEPYRQQLLKQLKERYLNDGLLPEDFEQLQHEPLDESTAAIYLGLLEESERMLFEALAV